MIIAGRWKVAACTATIINYVSCLTPLSIQVSHRYFPLSVDSCMSICGARSISLLLCLQSVAQQPLPQPDYAPQAEPWPHPHWIGDQSPTCTLRQVLGASNLSSCCYNLSSGHSHSCLTLNDFLSIILFVRAPPLLLSMPMAFIPSFVDSRS